jgi:putative membrane protein
MSAPTSPDSAVGAPERLHPLFLLNGLGRLLRSFSGAYALVAWLAVTGRWTTALLAAVAILLIGIVGTIIYWRRFEYRVGRDEIRIDSGILSRRHRSIPFDRIQDVDITQGPLARLLGLATVKFETGAGGGGANADEGVLHTIALQRAEEIRRLVRGSRPVTTEPAEQPVQERSAVYQMSFGRLLLAGAFNFSLALFAGLFGLTQTIGQPLGIDPMRESFWRNLSAASAPLERLVLTHRVAAAVAGIALLTLIGLGTGMIRTVLRDYGFRLDRTEAGFRRRRGLLTRTDVTLPIKRAQAAIMASGPVRGTFGWSELLLQSLAAEEGGKGHHVVAPLASKTESEAVLSELGWRTPQRDTQWQRVSKAFVWMRALALAPALLIAGILTGAILPTPPREPDATGQSAVATIIPLIVTILSVIAALLMSVVARWFAWWRTGYAIDSGTLLIRTGWWRRRLVILPAAKIQSIDLTENFITRWFGVASLRFGVAGGSIRGELIPAIPRAAARALRNQLLDMGA